MYPVRAKSAAKKLSFKRDIMLNDIQEEDIPTKLDPNNHKQNARPGGGKFTFLQPKPPPNISQR